MFPLTKFTSSLLNSRDFSALWVHCFHHVDTSCKWGTHVLRFFWRTYGNAYLCKNTFFTLVSRRSILTTRFLHPTAHYFTQFLYKPFFNLRSSPRLRRSSVPLRKSFPCAQLSLIFRTHEHCSAHCRRCHRARDSLATVLRNPRWPPRILSGRDPKSPTRTPTC